MKHPTRLSIARGPMAAAGVAQGEAIEATDSFSRAPSMFRGAAIERREDVPPREVAAMLRAIADDIEAHATRVAAIDIGSSEKQSGAKDVVLKIAFSKVREADGR